MNKTSVIKYYYSNYYKGIGRSYLIISGRKNTQKEWIIDCYCIFHREDLSFSSFVFTIKANKSTFFIFQNINELIIKEVLNQASDHIFSKYIYPIIDNDKEKNDYRNPVFIEDDKSRIYSLKSMFPSLLEKISAFTEDLSFKKYLDSIISLNIEIIQNELL
ncbi:MAG TPA: hypothetical protein VLZ83_10215 [Edaphocola sp.]|nr:hypothetical protein [Edaphocola sp.]